MKADFVKQRQRTPIGTQVVRFAVFFSLACLVATMVMLAS